MKLYRLERLRCPYGIEWLIRAETAFTAWRRARMSEAYSDVVVVELADETPDLAVEAARGRGRPYVVESHDHRVLAYCSSREQQARLADVIGGVAVG